MPKHAPGRRGCGQLVEQPAALFGSERRPVGVVACPASAPVRRAGFGCRQEQVGQPAESDRPEDALRIGRIGPATGQPLPARPERGGPPGRPRAVAQFGSCSVGPVAPRTVGELVIVERGDDRVRRVERLDVRDRTGTARSGGGSPSASCTRGAGRTAGRCRRRASGSPAACSRPRRCSRRDEGRSRGRPARRGGRRR